MSSFIWQLNLNMLRRWLHAAAAAVVFCYCWSNNGDNNIANNMEATMFVKPLNNQKKKKKLNKFAFLQIFIVEKI